MQSFKPDFWEQAAPTSLTTRPLYGFTSSAPRGGCGITDLHSGNYANSPSFISNSARQGDRITREEIWGEMGANWCLLQSEKHGSSKEQLGLKWWTRMECNIV